MHKISVIIVSWNARELLRNCLHSIEKQARGSVGQIIVVDNASNDGSPEMVAADFPTVDLIRCKENLGFAKANNLGIQRASGRFLALINSDVVVHEDCLERLAAFLDDNPEIGLVGPKVFGRDNKIQRTCKRFPGLWNTFCRTVALDDILSSCSLFSGKEMRHWRQDTQRDVDMLSGCFWMARSEAVRIVGGLDERFFFYAEDVDWCKRFWNSGWRVTYVPAATATHFDGGSSINAPLRYNIQMLRANLAYWEKHHGAVGKAAFLFLSIAHHVLRLAAFGLKLIFTGKQKPEMITKLQRSWGCLYWLTSGKDLSRQELKPPMASSRTMEQTNLAVNKGART